MHVTAAVLLLAALISAPALAVSPFEGQYQGRGEGRLQLRVFEVGDGTGAHFIIAETAIPNACTGELIGMGRPSGAGVLILHQTDSDADEVCTLTLRFSPDGKRVRMTPQGCGYFHGTSCDFDGELSRR